MLVRWQFAAMKSESPTPTQFDYTFYSIDLYSSPSFRKKSKVARCFSVAPIRCAQASTYLKLKIVWLKMVHSFFFAAQPIFSKTMKQFFLFCDCDGALAVVALYRIWMFCDKSLFKYKNVNFLTVRQFHIKQIRNKLLTGVSRKKKVFTWNEYKRCENKT